jgi:hypothetical protein
MREVKKHFHMSVTFYSKERSFTTLRMTFFIFFNKRRRV